MENLKFYQLQIGQVTYYIPEVLIAKTVTSDGNEIVDMAKSKPGFMSVEDYLKLQTVEQGAQVNLFNTVIYRKQLITELGVKNIDTPIPFDTTKTLKFTEGRAEGSIAINDVDVPVKGLAEFINTLTENGNDANLSIRDVAKNVFYGLIEGVSDTTLDTIKEIADFLIDHKEILDIVDIKKDIKFFRDMFNYIDVDANCTTASYDETTGTLILSGLNFVNVDNDSTTVTKINPQARPDLNNRPVDPSLPDENNIIEILNLVTYEGVTLNPNDNAIALSNVISDNGLVSYINLNKEVNTCKVEIELSNGSSYTLTSKPEGKRINISKVNEIGSSYSSKLITVIVTADDFVPSYIRFKV